MHSIEQRFRAVVLPFLRRLLPRRAKRWLKRFWDPNAPISATERRILRSRRDDAQGSDPRPARIPIVCFSIFDWGFRTQRPQHFLRRLARRGHDVYYVSRTDATSKRVTVRPLEPFVFEVVLPLRTPLQDLEAKPLTEETIRLAVEALETLRRERALHDALVYVQIPAWRPISAAVQERFGWRVVYDCMDDWEHFPGLSAEIVRQERALVAEADGVLVSSAFLQQKWSAVARRLALVRNGVEVEHFTRTDATSVLAGTASPIAGYVGAVAEWFDHAALVAAAAALPHWTFVVVGNVTSPAGGSIAALPNVILTGEKPYALVPAFVRRFDVCLIPFVNNELTRATDPVKLYEYFALGKPVVAAPLPEIAEHADLLYTASTAEEWAPAIERAHAERGNELLASRIALARTCDWQRRVDDVESVIRDAHPRLSVIVVTWGNLDLTRLCLESLLANAGWPNLEIIVVDNGSTDGTPEYLRSLGDHIRLVLNEENRGFAAANNQGVALATGDRILLLNNDTIVPPGLIGALLRHLEQPDVGLAVAVTNFSGNESRIDAHYSSIEGLPSFAAARRRDYDGRSFDIGVAAMYCVAMTRQTLSRVGPLDEEFRIGMFEDDDYSHRVRAAGLRVICAEDAYVHHFGRASFALLDQAAYDALFAENRRRFEAKWGSWKAHGGRRK